MTSKSKVCWNRAKGTEDTQKTADCDGSLLAVELQTLIDETCKIIS